MTNQEKTVLASIFAFAVVVATAMIAAIIISSMPTWCATPEVPGNAVVQPFCTR